MEVSIMASQMKVEAVIKQGASIVGYVIVNEKGNKVKVDRSYMCYMAAAGKVEGVTASLCDGKVIIRGLGKGTPVIKEEPKAEDKRTIVYMVKQGRNIVGCIYDGDNNIIPRDVFEADALAGKLTNVTAQRYQGKILLRATVGSMKDIPVKKILSGKAEEVEDTSTEKA